MFSSLIIISGLYCRCSSYNKRLAKKGAIKVGNLESSNVSKILFCQSFY